MSEATRWFVRLRRADADPAARREFSDWLGQEYDNVRDYGNCQLAVALAKELEADPALEPVIRDCRTLSQAVRARHREARGPFRPRFNVRVPLLAGALAFAACVSMVLVLGLSADRYETRVGEQRTIIAEDDSVITLNTDTRLLVEFDEKVRRVQLERGQAFFSVTPDRTRPFEVAAFGRRARAVGTSFDVAINKEYRRVTVTVLEGSVEILPSSEGGTSTPFTVLVGESVTYWENGAIAQVTQTDVNPVKAWRSGKMDFDNRRLADALAEHNRYTSKKIVVGDSALKDVRISGVFRIGDTDGLLFLLQESLGLISVPQENVILLLPKRKLREANDPPVPTGPNRG